MLLQCFDRAGLFGDMPINIRPFKLVTILGTTVAVIGKDKHFLAMQQVPGSVNLPLSQIDQLLPRQVDNLHRPLYLHCALGKRAAMAAAKAQQLGYQQVCVINRSAPLQIDYYTDLLCIWAWVAQPRIEQMKQQWGGTDSPGSPLYRHLR